MLRMPSVQSPDSTIPGRSVNRPISQIPECIRQISHNATFCNRNVHTCAHFCYKMLYCGIWHRCILGFVRWAYTVHTTNASVCSVHWNTRFAMMPTLSSLETPEVVIIWFQLCRHCRHQRSIITTKINGAASGGKVRIMTTLRFHSTPGEL